METRLVWDQEHEGSNPSIPTILQDSETGIMLGR